MKICPNCKEKFETGKFCQFCGSPLQDEVQELHCTACGAKLASGAKFCSECGAKVGVVSASKAAKEPATESEEEREVERGLEDEEVIYRLKLSIDLIHLDNEESRHKGFEMLSELAESGYRRAYYWLAECYLNGLGCNRNKVVAEYLHQVATRTPCKYHFITRGRYWCTDKDDWCGYQAEKDCQDYEAIPTHDTEPSNEGSINEFCEYYQRYGDWRWCGFFGRKCSEHNCSYK